MWPFGDNWPNFSDQKKRVQIIFYIEIFNDTAAVFTYKSP
jgi:hypothetical protein